MAATSMAAALAATLPAQTPAPSSSTPSYATIPASMSKMIDTEAEIQVTGAQLDGMVVSKILKHAQDIPQGVAHGLLLGLDLDGTFIISNSFALPSPSSDEEEKLTKSVARYQASMLRSLKEVQGEDSLVGFYQATPLGAFFQQSLLETHAMHYDKLRHGGVIIIYDTSQSARSVASFRAFRLRSPFLDAFKKSNFSTSSLSSHRLTFSSIMEEIPLKVRTNPLLGSFLSILGGPSASAGQSQFTPSFSGLHLGAAGLPKNLELLVETVDSYRNEESNLAYLSRQIARERAKAENYAQKRKEENLARVAQGLAPLPEEDVSRLFKIPPEPSRLESMLLLGQIDAYTRSLEGTANNGLITMYAVDSGCTS